MDVLERLSEKLKEEQWTRSTLEKYSVKDLTELDKMLDEIIKTHREKEVHEICLDFIKNSPKSIAGLYMLGFLSYELEDHKNAEAVIDLVETFKENKKWNIVEELLKKILEYEENIYALRLLMSIYDNFKKEEEKLEILRRLVSVDTENGDVAKRLAEIQESQGDKDGSIKSYKSALRRYAKGKQYSLAETIWKKIVSEIPEEINFFLNIASIVEDSNLDLSLALLTNLLEVLELEGKIDESIFIAKKILGMDSLNQKIKQKLIELYKGKYSGNSQLESCLANSGLNDPKVKIENAIKKFEKEILFDTGSYVYHRTWGIGTLTQISDDTFLINFDNKEEHKMSYAMALKSLIPLSPDHIWVLQKNNKIGDVNDPENMQKILLNILKSYPDKALSIENFKEDLVPGSIPSAKWNTWWNKAKNILKQANSVKTIKDGRPKYMLRDIKVRFEEELINSFFDSKRFDERLKIFEEFIKDSISMEDFSDFFREMITYFTQVIDNFKFDYNEQLISYILLRRMRKTYGGMIPEVPGNPEKFMDINKLIDVLRRNYKSDYKKDLITLIDRYYPNPIEALEQILWNDKGQLATFIMEKLNKHIDEEEYRALIDLALNSKFKTNPFITIWFLEYVVNNFENYAFKFTLKELFIEILYRVDTIGKLINQKKLNWFSPPLYSADAKKILTAANDFLFKDDNFQKFVLENSDLEYVTKIYHLIKSSTGLTSKKKNDLIRAIMKKYPQVDVNKSEDELITMVSVDYFDTNTIWSSQAGLERQKKRIETLREEKSLNVIELDKARDKGDLRENAEYQAAKEKDTNFNNQIMELTKLISITKVIDMDSISGEEVAPGTTVSLTRNGKKEKYTILGYWDTDENNHIIAYNSPLAKAIMGAQINEEREIELGGEEVIFKILDIQPYRPKK